MWEGGAAIFNWKNNKTNETTRKEWASGAPANLWVGVPGGPRGRAVGCCGSRGRAPGCTRASNMEAQSGMNMTSKHCYVTTRGGTPRSSRLRGMYLGATLVMGRHLRSSLSIHLQCGVTCCAMLCVCHACVPWCAILRVSRSCMFMRVVACHVACRGVPCVHVHAVACHACLRML